MIKLRLEGTPQEICKACEKIKQVFNVLTSSMFYPNKRPRALGESGRVYLEVEPIVVLET
jgi:hypothetical protein